jgi:DNA repair exonuclease SbcCD ATPase subunit
LARQVPNIILKSVKIKAFRSFAEEAVFTLPEAGVVLIDGKSLDTNDASGTGKTTFFYAVAYALGILPSGVKAKDLQCLFTKEKMQVEVEFKDRHLDKCYTVLKRGKQTSLETAQGFFQGPSVVDQKLYELFHVNSDMLASLVYRPQLQQGTLLGRKSVEVVDLLSSLLGLQLVELALGDGKNNVKKLKHEIAALKERSWAEIQVIQRLNYEKSEPIHQEMARAEEKLRVKKASQANKPMSAFMAKEIQVHDIIKKNKEKNQELRSQGLAILANLTTKEELVRRNLDLENKKSAEKIQKINLELQQINSIKNGLKLNKIKIEKLEKSLCPTCDRTWQEALVELEAARKIEQDYLESISHEPTWQALKKGEEAKIQSHVPDPQIREMEIAIASIGKDMSEEERALNKELRELQLEINKLNAEVTEAESELKAVKYRLDVSKKNEALVLELETKVAQYEKELEVKNAELQSEEDFLKVIGREGFLGSIFDEVLQEIVIKVNNKIKTVANLSGITFNYKTEVLDSKGELKKSITPVINLHGQETCLEMLSGGMRSSLDLIADLCLKEVVEARVGSSFGFYFIDEGFNGLGQQSKDACLEILKNNSAKCAYFVIDHHSEVKEHFTQVINIEMKNGQSYVKN